MKKSLFILAILLVSCLRQEPEKGNGLKTFTCFTVETENGEMTKAYLKDGGVVKWHDWDCIGVYSDTQDPVPYFRDTDGRFRGEPVTGNEFYAFYPYEEDCFDKDNRLCLRMNLGRGSIPMVAKTTDNTLLFKQTCGLLRFQIRIEGCNELVGASIDAPFATGGTTDYWGVQLSGQGIVDLSQSNPILQFGKREDYNNGSSLSHMGAILQDDWKWDIYFVVPETTFEDGLWFSVFPQYPDGSMKVFSKYTNKRIEIRRGQMKTFAAIDAAEQLSHQISEREALIAIYKALDGDNWEDNTNWCTDKPLEEWSGVGAEGDERVYRLFLTGSLKGTIPEEIGELKSLQELVLNPTNKGDIYGNIPEAIGNLQNLRVLDLGVTGYIPKSFENLKALTNLTLAWTCVDADVPVDGYSELSGGLRGISEMPLLEFIQLSFTHGFLDADFSGLKHLTDVLIPHNGDLWGPLPNISDFSHVRNVYMHMNHFSGPIPASYATALDSPYLQAFWIYGNCLTGEVPQEMATHPAFPEWAWMFLHDQREGYRLVIDKVPASRWKYPTFGGDFFDLGAAYETSDYTMIVRWSEQCPHSVSIMPEIIELANKYEDKGLQTIWAYSGGEQVARETYMQSVGLDKKENHIIECAEWPYFRWWTEDHRVWSFWMDYTPFFEVVDREGNIVFIGDDGRDCSQLPFSYHSSKLRSFLSQLLGGGDEGLYESADYSSDGTVHTLQTSTVGNGINVVLMGDAFSDRLIADGTYEGVMRNAMNALFSEEPYKSLQDRFNVYYIDAVSKNEVYYGETALSTWYGDGTLVGGDDDKVLEYAGGILSNDEIDDAVFIVMMNRDYYAGTCYMYGLLDGDYGRGLSVSYFPTSSDAETFDGIVSHEAGGHGFAKLADEYAYDGSMPEDEKGDRESLFPYGWWKNADFTSDPTKVKWSQFIGDNRYASENIGVFEGAFTYAYGAWRPTEYSIMRYNTGGFNAPSRYAIWYRINKLAYGEEWTGTYEDFAEFDLAHRPAAPSARTRPNYVEKQLPPLHPPVVVAKDWREVAGR